MTRKVAELQAVDDSPATRRLYGTIPNSHVRRRERRGVGAVPSAAPVKQEAKPAVKAAPKGAPSEVKAQEEPKAAVEASASAAGKETPASSASSVPKTVPSLKRGGSSNSGIMQAFSKAAAKPKKAKAPEPVDTPMSDDGEDDEEMPQARAPQAPSGRKSKKEREDELKRMMDDEDEEAEEEDAEEERPDSPVEEPAEEPTEEPQEAAPAKEEPKEIVSASADGRRRGKRRVMKKKQVMDDQGYLGKCCYYSGPRSHICRVVVADMMKSHYSRSRLGVFLRRRNPFFFGAQSKASSILCTSASGPSEGEESSWEDGARKYYVFFLQEVKRIACILREDTWLVGEYEVTIAAHSRYTIAVQRLP